MKQTKAIYVTPSVETAEVNAMTVLCQSGTTERYIVNDSGNYGDDAWE